jgi:hypothetical protein
LAEGLSRCGASPELAEQLIAKAATSKTATGVRLLPNIVIRLSDLRLAASHTESTSGVR